MTTTLSPAEDLAQRWDLSNVYSGLEGADYLAAMQRLGAMLDEQEALFDRLGVRRQETAPPVADKKLAADVRGVVQCVNEVSRLAETLDSFIYAFFTTDSYDPVAAREMSKLELLDTHRKKLGVRLAGWLGWLAERLPDLIAADPVLAEHQFFLQHTARQSKFLMSEALEALAAELVVDGGVAFGKLQGNTTSQLKVPFERDGKTEQLPITVVHNFCYAGDADLRRRGYDAEIAGWTSIRGTIAASMNSVKGTALTLAKRRGRESVLDEACDQNRIDRPTLDALLGAIREYFPMFRRYLASKAKKLGQRQLPWWDLFAPVGESHRTYSWSEAREFLIEKFAGFDDELADFCRTAFDRRWIDGAPRDGKRGGAYCMPVVGVDESRILANFDGSFEQLSTLAHELGHGFHNHCQRGLPPLRRGAPSTLAETASIFCETLIAEAAIADSEPAEQLMVLEAQVAGACQVCLDISSRFLFESRVLERRKSSELSPDELCEIMRRAQAETYGEGVDPATYHPYMWLWKPHYYSYSHNFYNFPYAFGHLFGLGLFAVYQQTGAADFVPRYKALLRATEEDYAAPLAKRFGIDITQLDFWRASLRIVEQQAARYEKL